MEQEVCARLGMSVYPNVSVRGAVNKSTGKERDNQDDGGEEVNREESGADEKGEEGDGGKDSWGCEHRRCGQCWRGVYEGH